MHSRLTRLDNAALIYTSTLSDTYACKFRVSVTLDSNIDRKTLNKALAAVIERFPSFRYRLRLGILWWYFKPIDQLPSVSGPCRLDPLPFNEKAGYLFKVSIDGATINMDVFHSLADGTAAMTFLLTLASEYLHLKKGVKIVSNNWVKDPCEVAKAEEYEDAFDSFTSVKGNLEKGAPAYHVKGSVEDHDVLHNMRLAVRTDDLVREARNYGCTVTDLLSAAMIRSLQRIREEDSRSSKRSSIKISIPVNLRKIYGYNTMRNFSSYVNVGIDENTPSPTIQDIIRCVSSQKKELLTRSSLETKISANVTLENNFFIQLVPWPLKKVVMSIIHRLKGDRLCSQTLSNLGVIELPESMKRHIRGIDFQLGRSVANFGSCGCVTFGGITTLNFSRRIKETLFERYFMEELSTLGVSFA